MNEEVKKHSAFQSQAIGIGVTSIGVIIPRAICEYIGISKHDQIELVIKKVASKDGSCNAKNPLVKCAPSEAAQNQHLAERL